MNDFSIILSVGKCSWGKCNFCGWGKLNFGKKSIEELQNQFLKQYKKIKKDKPFRLKFYVSGSFFDEQVPEDFFNWLVEFLKKEKLNNLQAVLFETKIIDLLNKKRIEKFVELSEEGIETWVGIGLESANNEVLRKINKDFQSIEQFEKITKKVKEKYPIKFRVYTLINPPIEGNYYIEGDNYWETWTYNKNREIIEFNVELLNELKKYYHLFEEVVLINTYPHKNAEAFWLFYNKKWRPLTYDEFKEIIKNVFGEFFKEKIINNTKFETDFSNYSFIPQFPEELKREYSKKIKGAKFDNLINRVYEIWEEYFLYFFEPSKDKDILFLLPCAARKPYFLSKTHRLIKNTISGFQIFKRMHWVVVSNPGIIPYEFVSKWPFKNYDWPEWEETPEIQELYYKITKERVKRYLESHKDKYKAIIYFFKPDSLTYKAVNEAINELGLKNVYFAFDKDLYYQLKEKYKKPLFSKELLDNFKEKLKEIQKIF